MPVAEDLVHGGEEALKTLAARIALIALHDAGPLLRGHRPGARISQQIDEYVFRRQQKQVVVRGLEQLFAFVARGPADGFYALYAEGLYDSASRHGTSRPHAVPEVCDRYHQGTEALCLWVFSGRASAPQSRAGDLGYLLSADLLGQNGGAGRFIY